MADLSPSTGVALLYDEGILPPNPSRQALAFASPAQDNKLGSDGLAARRTATVIAMEDEKSSASVELSPEAMQFLVNDLASPEPSTSQSNALPQNASGYPYGGWSAVCSPSISTELSTAPVSASTINLVA